MLGIKIMVVVSTLLVGFFYTRGEWAKMTFYFKQEKYLDWKEMNRRVALREMWVH